MYHSFVPLWESALFVTAVMCVCELQSWVQGETIYCVSLSYREQDKNGWNNESRWVMQCVWLIFPRSRMSQAVSVLFSSACMQNNKVYNWASTVEVFICMSARPRKHTSLSWRCLLPTSVCQHLCYNKNKPARPSSRLASEFAGQNRHAPLCWCNVTSTLAAGFINHVLQGAAEKHIRYWFLHLKAQGFSWRKLCE